MGSEMARLMSRKKGLEIVGAVEVIESMIGKDLGDVIGVGKKMRVKVSNDIGKVLSGTRPDIVLYATAGVLEKLYPQISPALKAGIDVISTCEDLAYPFKRQPELSKKIDREARKYGVTVLGTGSVPGFVFDTFLIVLCGVCEDIRRIEASRTTDYSVYGELANRRWGIGRTLTLDQYRAAVANKELRIMEPIMDSVHMVADVIGWELDDAKITSEPIISKTTGRMSGFRQRTVGIAKGVEFIILNYACSIMPKEDGLEINDVFSIEGKPNMNLVIKGGFAGDAITVANNVNMIPHVMNAEPGLKTMKDFVVPQGTLSDVTRLLRI